MATEDIVTDGVRVRKQSDLPGASDQIVYYMGRAQPASVAGVGPDDDERFVVDDTDPQRVRRYSETDEASAPTPPPPPPSVAWNPADKSAGVTLSNGNLTATVQGSEQARATLGRSTGKWYFEVVAVANVAQSGFGFSDLVATVDGGSTQATEFLWFGGGLGWIWLGTTWDFTVKTIALSEVGGLAIDLDAGKAWVRNFAGWSGDPVAGTGGNSIGYVAEPVYPVCGAVGGAVDNDITANFGATAFAYTVPSGFAAWDAP